MSTLTPVDARSAQRPEPDALLLELARFAHAPVIDSALAMETAHYCLMDTLACGLMALRYPACTRLLGPIVRGATLVTDGQHVRALP